MPILDCFGLVAAFAVDCGASKIVSPLFLVIWCLVSGTTVLIVWFVFFWFDVLCLELVIWLCDSSSFGLMSCVWNYWSDCVIRLLLIGCLVSGTSDLIVWFVFFWLDVLCLELLIWLCDLSSFYLMSCVWNYCSDCVIRLLLNWYLVFGTSVLSVWFVLSFFFLWFDVLCLN